MAGSFGMMALAALVTVGGLGAQAADAPGFIRVLPEDVRWTPMANTPGVMIAILAGDPGRAGPYVVRVKFPAHVMDTPHFHSADRYVTVLKGTWYAGTGKQFDPAAAIPMPAGSYMFHPAGGAHWDGSNSGEDVIVQIVGIGPVTTSQVDPKAAEWVKLKP